MILYFVTAGRSIKKSCKSWAFVWKGLILKQQENKEEVNID